jgi:hypothetical protein
MGTAVIGLLGVIVGVLLGGGVQLLVSWRERRAQSKRAARLLFGDCQLCLEAVEWLKRGDRQWYPASLPALDGWRKHREALAGAMDGPAFQTVDGAFYRVAKLDAWIKHGQELADLEVDAEETAQQLEEASMLLLVEGFSGSERERMQQEMSAARRRAGTAERR